MGMKLILPQEMVKEARQHTKGLVDNPKNLGLRVS